MNDLQNKVAYITGGSKGIGYGTAKILLGLGMRVAITSRSLQAAQEAAATLSSDPSKVLALQSEVELDSFRGGRSKGCHRPFRSAGCAGSQCRRWAFRFYRKPG